MKTTTLLFFICFCYFPLHSLPMQGNYTIDINNTGGGTHFQTWTDFKNAIVVNGVSGPVTVDVLTDMTLTGQINLSFQTINGVSSINQVIIKGHGKYLSMDVTDAVIILNGASWFTFDSVVIRNTSSSADLLGFRLTNNASHNTISNCIIEFSNCVSKVRYSGAYIAISDSLSALMSATTQKCNYNTISRTLMRTTNPGSPGPGFGIVVNGDKNRYNYEAQNTTIRENIIQNFSCCGIFMSYTNGNHVIQNDISRTNADTNNCDSVLNGIYSFKSYSTQRSSRIDSNFLHHLPYGSATAIEGPQNLNGIFTRENKGSSVYPFSVSYNRLEKLNSSRNLFMTHNIDNTNFDQIGNDAYDSDVPVSTSPLVNFYGFYNSGTSGSYRLNGNTIQKCDGGYSWYGISSELSKIPSGLTEINENRIFDNQHAYYYRYNIYSSNSSASDSNQRIEIKRNLIRKNVSDFMYHYNIYAVSGNCEIHDNIIDSNVSNFPGYYGLSLYGIYAGNYGNYSIRGNRITGNRSLSKAYAQFHGISVYKAFDTEIYSNLITGNIGTAQTGGISVSNPQIGVYKAIVMQNTVVIDGKLSGYASHTAYPFALSTYNSLYFRGNIADVQNTSLMNVELNTKGNLYCDHNTFYTFNNVIQQSWQTKLGNTTSDTAFLNLNPGIQNFRPAYGHYFDSVWASKLKWNQDNVPSSKNNLTDVYGVVRSSSFSDRGAVEYSGVTSVSHTEKRSLSRLYPNPPLGAQEVYLLNSNHSLFYRIFNISGQELMSGTLESGINPINIGLLDTGTYLIFLDNEELPLRLLLIN